LRAANGSSQPPVALLAFANTAAAAKLASAQLQPLDAGAAKKKAVRAPPGRKRAPVIRPTVKLVNDLPLDAQNELLAELQSAAKAAALHGEDRSLEQLRADTWLTLHLVQLLGACLAADYPAAAAAAHPRSSAGLLSLPISYPQFVEVLLLCAVLRCKALHKPEPVMPPGAAVAAARAAAAVSSVGRRGKKPVAEPKPTVPPLKGQLPINEEVQVGVGQVGGVLLSTGEVAPLWGAAVLVVRHAKRLPATGSGARQRRAAHPAAAGTTGNNAAHRLSTLT
jgi:hypothetical protein